MTKSIFVVLLVIAVMLLLIILRSNDTATRDWARNLFAGIVGLLAGFAGGSKITSTK